MIADRPSLATDTSNPANRREVASSSRMLGSSSTTSSEASATAVSVTLESVVRIPGSLLGATRMRRPDDVSGRSADDSSGTHGRPGRVPVPLETGLGYLAESTNPYEAHQALRSSAAGRVRRDPPHGRSGLARRQRSSTPHPARVNAGGALVVSFDERGLGNDNVDYSVRLTPPPCTPASTGAASTPRRPTRRRSRTASPRVPASSRRTAASSRRSRSVRSRPRSSSVRTGSGGSSPRSATRTSS